jgi:hypothetical protein
MDGPSKQAGEKRQLDKWTLTEAMVWTKRMLIAFDQGRGEENGLH